MEIIKDSNGDFVCPICSKAYLNEDLANTCFASHDGDRDVLALTRVKTIVSEIAASFGLFDGNSNTLGVNERLVMMMLEDYVLSREQDMVNRGKVSPLSMQLSKNVNEALSNLNKLKYGTKSLSVSARVEDETSTVFDVLDKVLKKPKKPSKEVRSGIIDGVIEDA